MGASSSRWTPIRPCWIETLTCTDFRNYASVSVGFAPGLNVLVGRNGSGKTNLLEAVHCVATGRSPRGAADPDLARHGCAGFQLAAASPSHFPDGLVIRYSRERGRTVSAPGTARAQGHGAVPRLPAVFFSPDDLWIVKGPPSARRGLLDRLLSQASRTYAATLSRYEEVLRQRNALLAEIRARRAARSLLEIWDPELLQCGVDLMVRRCAALGHLAPDAAQEYGRLSGGEVLQVAYAASAAGGERITPGLSRDEMTSSLRRALEASRQADVDRGFTLVGPHRDDLVLEVSGASARGFASQGQQRSAILALRLAERHLLASVSGEEPILLLDDVGSELDGARRAALEDLLGGGGQVFVTTTALEEKQPAATHPPRVFRVDGGRVEQEGVAPDSRHG